MVESLEGLHESQPFADIKAAAGSPKFSPDGRWLAYCSNESKTPGLRASISRTGRENTGVK